jgi:transcription antitermination factor NusA-like protein
LNDDAWELRAMPRDDSFSSKCSLNASLSFGMDSHSREGRKNAFSMEAEAEQADRVGLCAGYGGEARCRAARRNLGERVDHA